jgi:hypothetical protein
MFVLFALPRMFIRFAYIGPLRVHDVRLPTMHVHKERLWNAVNYFLIVFLKLLN